MATRIEFCVRTFCGVDVIPSNENPLLQTTFTHSDFWLVTDWRNWEPFYIIKAQVFVSLRAITAYFGDMLS